MAFGCKQSCQHAWMASDILATALPAGQQDHIISFSPVKLWPLQYAKIKVPVMIAAGLVVIRFFCEILHVGAKELGHGRWQRQVPQ